MPVNESPGPISNKGKSERLSAQAKFSKDNINFFLVVLESNILGWYLGIPLSIKTLSDALSLLTENPSPGLSEWENNPVFLIALK